jgi:hypothetical protein
MNIERYIFGCLALLSICLHSVRHEVRNIDGVLVSSSTLKISSSDELFANLEHIDYNVQLLGISTLYFKKFIYERCADNQTVWQKFCKSLESFRNLKYLEIPLYSFNSLKVSDTIALAESLRFIQPGVSIIFPRKRNTDIVIPINSTAFKLLALALKQCNFYNYRDGIWHQDIEMSNKEADLIASEETI